MVCTRRTAAAPSAADAVDGAGRLVTATLSQAGLDEPIGRPIAMDVAVVRSATGLQALPEAAAVDAARNTEALAGAAVATAELRPEPLEAPLVVVVRGPARPAAGQVPLRRIAHVRARQGPAAAVARGPKATAPVKDAVVARPKAPTVPVRDARAVPRRRAALILRASLRLLAQSPRVLPVAMRTLVAA